MAQDVPTVRSDLHMCAYTTADADILCMTMCDQSIFIVFAKNKIMTIAKCSKQNAVLNTWLRASTRVIKFPTRNFYNRTKIYKG